MDRGAWQVTVHGVARGEHILVTKPQPSVTQRFFVFCFFNFQSYIYKYMYLFLKILFPFRLLQNIEPYSLYYTVGPYWLSILNIPVLHVKVFPGGSAVTNLPTMHWKHMFDLWVGMIPRRRAWQPTPIFLPGESHGQKSLMGSRTWGHRESDMTEAT